MTNSKKSQIITHLPSKAQNVKVLFTTVNFLKVAAISIYLKLTLYKNYYNTEDMHGY